MSEAENEPLVFEALTKYLGFFMPLGDVPQTGGRLSGTLGWLLGDFENEYRDFVASHPYLAQDGFVKVLRNHGITYSAAGLREADVSEMEDRAVLSLITAADSAPFRHVGALKELAWDGTLALWLRRLKEIDDAGKSGIVSQIRFERVANGTSNVCSLKFNETSAVFEANGDRKTYSSALLPILRENFAAIKTEAWEAEYRSEGTFDQENWELTVIWQGGRSATYSGIGAYPPGYQALANFFKMAMPNGR